jgi:hypothetical protein
MAAITAGKKDIRETIRDTLKWIQENRGFGSDDEF